MSNTLGSQLYSNTNGIEFSVRMAKIIFVILFLVLFISPTVLFGIINKSHSTI